jgi:hypothetical protein
MLIWARALALAFGSALALAFGTGLGSKKCPIRGSMLFLVLTVVC